VTPDTLSKLLKNAWPQAQRRVESEDYSTLNILVGPTQAAYFYGPSPEWPKDMLREGQFTGMVTVRTSPSGIEGLASRLGSVVRYYQPLTKTGWGEMIGPADTWLGEEHPFGAH